MPGSSGYKVIVLFIIFGLLLSARQGGLTALVAEALRMDVYKTSQEDWRLFAPEGAGRLAGRGQFGRPNQWEEEKGDHSEQAQQTSSAQ